MENTNYICRSGMSSLSTLLFPHKHIFKKRFYLFIFRERGREGEREGEKHQCVVVCCTSPTGDPAGNPGMCPNWESNWQRFDLQAHAQSTELHQPGYKHIFDNVPLLYLNSLQKYFLYISSFNFYKNFVRGLLFPFCR